jgi:hypothetical protein
MVFATLCFGAARRRCLTELEHLKIILDVDSTNGVAGLARAMHLLIFFVLYDAMNDRGA